MSRPKKSSEKMTKLRKAKSLRNLNFERKVWMILSNASGFSSS
jgi:hypothetical protein